MNAKKIMEILYEFDFLISACSIFLPKYGRSATSIKKNRTTQLYGNEI
jgi:hypothetical protein